MHPLFITMMLTKVRENDIICLQMKGCHVEYSTIWKEFGIGKRLENGTEQTTTSRHRCIIIY